MDVKELAIKLARTETEDEVVQILKDEGYWDDYSYWRSFGDNDNNFSTIGNQQSKPDAALVEKFINSVDAILMKECMKRGIDMSGPDAPKSMTEALTTFFSIKEGQLSYLDSKKRNRMSESIILAATGNKWHMNLTLADQGEGQTPNRMPDTILSVSKNNKLRVPFVQGKFNMGGTGVLPFCGKNKFQLVISRRCPDIPNNSADDSFDYWSVTIVRRESGREGRRSSMFTYLTDKAGNLLRFKADSLPIVPVAEGTSYESMFYGTYFKLFDYALQGYKTNIVFDLNYRMSALMPELAHPIRFRECRQGYKGNTLEVTLSGLQTRLYDDRENNIEEGFPCSDTFNIDGQPFRCSVYVFKQGKSKRYRKKDGIFYIINGQTHACVSDSFFNKVNLSYLADSILVMVDCSGMDVIHREDMFMNSRDRLRDGEFSKAVEERIKEMLRSNTGLKKLQNERRAAAVKERLNDDKPLQDVLQNILSKSPVLSKILLSGSKLSSPFNITATGGTGDTFVGKKHPTFFTVKGRLKDGLLQKSVPINHDFRVQFETDVENDYFMRPVEQGGLVVKMDGVPHPELVKHLGLFNGTATLTISLPKGIKVGDVHEFETEIDDDYIVLKFPNHFKVTALPEEEYGGGGNGKRTPPRGKKKEDTRQEPGAAMPYIKEVYRADWEQHNMNKESALIVRITDDGSDYFLNMDNQYLLTELKGIRDQNKIALTKARYKYSMALVGMSVVSHYKNLKDADVDVSDEVSKVSAMIAPILIPMIEAMADLDLDEE